METKQWYILYTNPRVEKKICGYLKKYEIENYLPLLKIKKKWSDRYKTIETPLFSSYVFVNINYWGKKNTVLNLPGAHHFVHYKKIPAFISNEDIEMIKIFVKEFPDQIKIKKEERLKPGKKVFIKYGSFAGRTAEIKKVKSNVKVILKLPMLNAEVSVEMPIDNLGLEELE